MIVFIKQLMSLVAILGGLAGCQSEQSKGSAAAQARPQAQAEADDERVEDRDGEQQKRYGRGEEIFDLALAEGDEVLAVGRPGQNLISVVTSSGLGYALDLAAKTVVISEPFSDFDAKATTALAVSAAYEWVFLRGDNQVGRNLEPPDTERRFEISKVALDEVVNSAKEFVPLAATDEQLILTDRSALLVCTFALQSINLKLLPLPEGRLGKGEKILGAGPLGSAASAQGYWLATASGLMQLDTKGVGASWSEPSAAFPKGRGNDELLHVSMFYADAVEQPGKSKSNTKASTIAKAASPTGKIIGIFPGGKVREILKPKAESAKDNP